MLHLLPSEVLSNSVLVISGIGVSSVSCSTQAHLCAFVYLCLVVICWEKLSFVMYPGCGI